MHGSSARLRSEEVHQTYRMMPWNGSTNYDLEFQMNTLRTHPHPIHVHTYIHTQAHLAAGVCYMRTHTHTITTV